MSSPDALPPEVARLLLDVVADGFVLYCCGRRADPAALVASYEWPGHVDLVTIRDFDLITAARVPKPDSGAVDVFAPDTAVWAYQGPAQAALRALLELVHPLHADAPDVRFPAPYSLHIARHEQRPMTIRLPTPGRAGTRATRLAAVLSPVG